MIFHIVQPIMNCINQVSIVYKQPALHGIPMNVGKVQNTGLALGAMM